MNDNNQTKLPPKNNQNSDQNDQYQDVLNQYANIINSQPPKEEPTVPEELGINEDNNYSETIDKNVDQVKNSLVNSSQIEPVKTEKLNQTEPAPQNSASNTLLEIKPETPPVLSHNIDIDETEISKAPTVLTTEPPKPQIEKPQELPPIPEPQKTPEELKSELLNIINTPTSNDPQSPDPAVADSTPPTKKGVAPYKIFFFISLFVFLGVAGALAYNLFFSGKTPEITNNPNDLNPSPTETILVGDYKCALNDQQYKSGEYFQTADGCNTCTCNENGTIDCTDKACPATKSATVVTPSKSATTSSIPKDWKTYTDKEIGFVFNYPSNIKSVENKSFGGLYSITFNSKTYFAGAINATTGITVDRGGNNLDFAGYTKSGNQINYFNDKNKSVICSSKLINKIYKNPAGLEIVLLKGQNDPSTEEGMLGPCETYQNGIKALVNTKNKTYPGVAFETNELISETDLLKILDTLKFN